MELQKVVVWEHSLKHLAGDLNRARLLLADLSERIEGAMDAVFELDTPSHAWETLHSVRAIMGLIEENLTTNEERLDGMALNEMPSPTRRQAPTIPPNVNLDDFRDSDTAGMMSEYFRQSRIIEAAAVDIAIIAQVVNSRGELPCQLRAA